MDDRAYFEQALHSALNHLYDPVALRGSPLVDLLGVSGARNPARALQAALTGAIEELAPGSETPARSPARRFYHILYYRYTEQSTQHEVAIDLALSIRQLRRSEKLAVRALADALWDKHDLGKADIVPASAPAAPQAAGRPKESDGQDAAPTREEELQRLRLLSPEPIALATLLQNALGTLAPGLRSAGIQVQQRIPASLPPIWGQMITLRQALLNILTVATRIAPGGSLDIQARRDGDDVIVSVAASLPHGSTPPPLADHTDTLQSTETLIDIAGGTLISWGRVEPDIAFAACLRLPLLHQVKVLGIDDNQDILQMMSRYLSGTRYQFTGTAKPHEALALAQQFDPDIIVLDIMLPGVDGWELVGRLREHPITHRIPIIICTILPQQDLADLLGAAGFIRKPVNRAALLAALDRRFGQLAKETGSSPRSQPADGASTAPRHG